MTIAVFGLGKLGSPLAAWFASAGHRVLGVDVNPDITRSLESGISPVEEPGLQALLDKLPNAITCDIDPVSAVSQSDFVFLIVPTPSDDTGRFSNHYLKRALLPVAHAIRDSAHPVIVIVSTVMPGSTEAELIPFIERESCRACGIDFDVCYNPEFIALGSILSDMAHPSFVLIGESSRKAGDALEAFYRDLHTRLGNPVPPIARMNFVNAEICKLSVNCFVTTKISYANQIAALCESVPKANAATVCATLGLDRRINPLYLKPATCYGGPCFPRDNVALRAYASELDISMPLADATDAVNRKTTERLMRLILSGWPGSVAILGLTYKPDTPSTEESQATHLLNELANSQHIKVFTHDPAARLIHPAAVQCDTAQEAISQADTVAITTPWGEYRSLNPVWFRPNAKIIDCWNILPDNFCATPCRNLTLVRIGACV